VAQNPIALKYASNALKHDREVALAAVKKNWEVVRELPPALRTDPEVKRAMQEQLYAANGARPYEATAGAGQQAPHTVEPAADDDDDDENTRRGPGFGG
jgi:hypothetical protein